MDGCVTETINKLHFPSEASTEFCSMNENLNMFARSTRPIYISADGLTIH